MSVLRGVMPKNVVLSFELKLRLL